MKVELDAQGLSILSVHHLHPLVPIFVTQIGRNIITYDMCFDHDILKADFTNVQIFDCTRDPKTIDPTIYPEKIIDLEAKFKNIDLLIR